MPAIQTRNAQTIAPHYFVVCREFSRLHDKLSRALVSPTRPHGPVVQDGLAALDLWQRWLQESAKRLPAQLRRFSATILAPSSRPDQRRTMAAIIDLEQEVGRLIHLHKQLSSQSMTAGYEEGRRLLACCLTNLAQDLLDLFAFFCKTMAAHIQAAPARPRTHVWTRPLTCGPYWPAYRTWRQGLAEAMAPDHVRRWLPLWWRQDIGSLAGRIKTCLYYLITREKAKKASCCC